LLLNISSVIAIKALLELIPYDIIAPKDPHRQLKCGCVGAR